MFYFHLFEELINIRILVINLPSNVHDTKGSQVKLSWQYTWNFQNLVFP